MGEERRYRIITAADLTVLEKKVNELMDEGWLPQGGVSWVYDGYAQAMLRPRSLEEEFAELFGEGAGFYELRNTETEVPAFMVEDLTNADREI